MLIYLIRNKVSGKCYVGQTIGSLKERWWKHISTARQGYRVPISLAIASYGADKFDVSVLAEADDIDTLNRLEQEFIRDLGTIVPGGYNLHVGGRNHKPHPDTIEKCRLASLGNTYGLGRKASEETRRRQSEAHKRITNFHKHSEETKKKLSDKAKGRSGYWKGKVRPPEMCKKMALARRQYKIDPQELISLYASGLNCTELGERYGCHGATIRLRLLGEGVKIRKAPRGMPPVAVRRAQLVESLLTCG